MTDWDRIRVLWPDHLGLARGKYLPARLAHKGTSHCVCVFALGYDRSMVPAPGAYLLDGLPDTQISFDTDGFDEVNTDVHCAHSLSAALDDMEADEALCEAVGSELCANFVFNKRAEWDRYTAGAGDEAVSDWDAITGTEPLSEWEFKQYLPYH